MGSKRPFDAEEFPELHCKHPRKLEYSNMPDPCDEHVPCDNAPQEPIISGEYEDGLHKFQCHEALEKDTVTDVSNLVDKGFGTNDPLSLVSSSSSEEDARSGASAYSSIYPEYFELDFPRRRFVPFEDAYHSFLDHFPRKQVPIGTNHQASIPLWGKLINENNLDMTEKFTPSIDDGGSEEMLMGTLIVSMPDSNLSTDRGDYAGDGRADCHCLDSGSIRCICQHIMEAREKLRRTLGEEKFVNLGFSDMGEEVAHKWTEEEEQIFHEAVYSSPASLGRNFWKHLSLVFPSRSKSELVSYYFNVFMLRRRAAQNRSNLLDIDSDDDEWHGRGSYEVGESEEDVDSAIESPVDQDSQANSSEEDDGSDDDDDNDDDNNKDGGDDDCNGDGGDRSGRDDVLIEDGGMNLPSDAHAKLIDESKFDPLVQHVDKTSGSDQEDLSAQDDSCLSFDCQANMTSSCDPVNSKNALQVCGVKSEHTKCLHGKDDWSNDAVGQFNLLEPYDAKVWDGSCPSASLKGFDLVSTWNMIEEIFGQGTSDKKVMDD
ncbi:uncharacterized protein LOC121254993 isoform X2 [Juglans microcarpa x Juglans regia]|uniref:uncharacterized protein LOC121254993 isoform X2 n=1 Tax=Juglans microcarpa x Juglans regia TaxID=2249226 RepID=UPI001B7EABFD|nr:uncharacterized protein LOC121254993 isoform X2 [Juglans microcarpa x Juglans regia]XP_041011221.1 uncharacterized protein LOC121254993 isoform X2 [Juglans microcarpa x Juglans regia]